MKGYVQKAAILNRPTRAKHLEEYLKSWNVWVPCSICPPYDGDPIHLKIIFDSRKGLEFEVYIPARFVMFTNKYLKHSLPLPCWKDFQKALEVLKVVTSAPDYWSRPYFERSKEI